jgi:Ser/Thr protein kinase RdoA (MazF antagonist)
MSGNASFCENSSMIPENVCRAFGLTGTATRLTGGSGSTYLLGNVVLKRLHRTSLESEHSLALAPWLAGELAQVEQVDFRLSAPLASRSGQWMLEDGWTAWTFLEGRHADDADVPAVIDAVTALHHKLGHVRKHPLLDANTTPWGFAHRYCWRDQSVWVHPLLTELVAELYARYRPLPSLPCQLIHGDLNVDNIIVTPDQPPGFIDFTPFWAPVDFAIAIFANWVGPRRGDVQVLKHFEDIPHFPQLLLRSSVRMLLIVSELNGVAGWEDAPEKRAAELVLEWVH